MDNFNSLKKFNPSEFVNNIEDNFKNFKEEIEVK
jgi:hypothetical protein